MELMEGVVEESGSDVGVWMVAEEERHLTSGPYRSLHSKTERTCACPQSSHLVVEMRLVLYKMRKHSEFLHPSLVLWKPFQKANLFCFQL